MGDWPPTRRGNPLALAYVEGMDYKRKSRKNSFRQLKNDVPYKLFSLGIRVRAPAKRKPEACHFQLE